MQDAVKSLRDVDFGSSVDIVVEGDVFSSGFAGSSAMKSVLAIESVLVGDRVDIVPRTRFRSGPTSKGLKSNPHTILASFALGHSP